MKLRPIPLATSIALTLVLGASAQTIKGPSTASTPYLLPTQPGWEFTSVLTVDNTGATADDTVPKVGGGTFSMNGIPDGMGAYDNGSGQFTLVMNHEFGNTQGVTRAHGSNGAYVSKFTINKNTLGVVDGEDLMKQIYT